MTKNMSIPSESEIVKDIAQQAHDAGETTSERVQWIFRYCSDIAPGDTDDPDLILSQANSNASPLGRARTMVGALSQHRHPGPTGDRLRDQATAQREASGVGRSVHGPVVGAVRSDQRFHAVHLPMNFVPVRRGGDQTGPSLRCVKGHGRLFDRADSSRPRACCRPVSSTRFRFSTCRGCRSRCTR